MIHHELRRACDFAVWISLELVYDFRGRQPWRNFLDFFFQKEKNKNKLPPVHPILIKPTIFTTSFVALQVLRIVFDYIQVRLHFI